MPAGQGVDLDAGDQLDRRRHRAGRATSSRYAASVSWSVIARRRDPGRRGGADELDRLEDAVGAERVGVEVDGRRPPARGGRRGRGVPAWACRSPRSDLDEPLDPLDRERAARSPGRCRSGRR